MSHIAKYCNRDYRSVKCDQNHGPKECKLEKVNEKNRNELYCVNCQTQGHPASYMGCPKILGLKTKIKNRIEINKNKRLEKLQKINKLINPAISYASVATNNNSNENNSNLNLNQKTPDRGQDDLINRSAQDSLEKMLEAFKMNLMTFITNELSSIKIQININTEKINLIMNLIKNDEP